MNDKEREEYYTSLHMLDKHIIYTSKQEKKYKNDTIILRPGYGPIYFELQFDLGNSTQTRLIFTYSLETMNRYSKSFVNTAIMVSCGKIIKAITL